MINATLIYLLITFFLGASIYSKLKYLNPRSDNFLVKKSHIFKMHAISFLKRIELLPRNQSNPVTTVGSGE